VGEENTACLLDEHAAALGIILVPVTAKMQAKFCGFIFGVRFAVLTVALLQCS
jgi:hypothetical protein